MIADGPDAWPAGCELAGRELASREPADRTAASLVIAGRVVALRIARGCVLPARSAIACRLMGIPPDAAGLSFSV